MEKVLACVLLLNVIVCVQSLGLLNDHCQHVSECGKYGYFCSKNRTCQCFQGYIPNGSFKRCVGGVNQDCKYDEHCIEGAYCEKQSKCQCKEEFFASDDGLACTIFQPRASHASLVKPFPFLLLPDSATIPAFPGLFLIVILLIYFKIV